jgi:hypothetical protein
LHSSLETSLRNEAIALQSRSTVRAFILRKNDLGLAKSCSMGFRSGCKPAGKRRMRREPRLLLRPRRPCEWKHCPERRSVPQGWRKDLFDIGQEERSIHRAIQHKRARGAIERSPHIKVVVFQWPCGTLSTSRSPCGALPCVRPTFHQRVSSELLWLEIDDSLPHFSENTITHPIIGKDHRQSSPKPEHRVIRHENVNVWPGRRDLDKLHWRDIWL